MNIGRPEPARWHAVAVLVAGLLAALAVAALVLALAVAVMTRIGG